MESEPVSGPGARMFEMTPDEESLWAAISPDEFISEELIEIHRRGEFSDDDVAIMEECSPEAGQRAGLIAYYDKLALRGKNDADALRAGAPLPDGDWGIGIPQPVEDAAEWVGDEFVESQREQSATRDRIHDGVGDFFGALWNANVRADEWDNERLELETEGDQWGWERRAEGRERLRNANVRSPDRRVDRFK